MKLKLFWVCWSLDALICLIIAVFFVLGLIDGSVSSFNIGIWIAIFAAVGVVIGGGFWLKTLGFPVLATVLLLVLAIPSLLCVVFIVLLVATGAGAAPPGCPVPPSWYLYHNGDTPVPGTCPFPVAGLILSIP